MSAMKNLLKVLLLPVLISGCTGDGGHHAEPAIDRSPTADAPSFQSGLTIPVMPTVVAGNRIYYVRLRIGGGPETLAILDTGSHGLRVMAALVPDRNTAGKPIAYSFESGTELRGRVSNESVSAGHHALGTVPVQVVDDLRCAARLPDCAIARLDPSTPFARGIDGRTSPEFGAILGIRLFTGVGFPVPNPLKALGFERWVVQLPRDNASHDGALVLDPSLAELNGFTRLKVDEEGQVAACLDGGDAMAVQCLPANLDTGDPHVFVFLPAVDHHVLAADKPMTLGFSDTASRDPKIVFRFTSAHADITHDKARPRYDPALVSFIPLRGFNGKPFINTGYLPFTNYSILFDAGERVIGMRPRAPSAIPLEKTGYQE